MNNHEFRLFLTENAKRCLNFSSFCLTYEWSTVFWYFLLLCMRDLTCLHLVCYYRTSFRLNPLLSCDPTLLGICGESRKGLDLDLQSCTVTLRNKEAHLTLTSPQPQIMDVLGFTCPELSDSVRHPLCPHCYVHVYKCILVHWRWHTKGICLGECVSIQSLSVAYKVFCT